MKRLLLTILIFTFALSSIAQIHDLQSLHHNRATDSLKVAPAVVTPPHHRKYIAPAAYWTPGHNLDYSLEAGIWGVASNTSFAGIFDLVSTDHKLQPVIGAKSYCTSFNGAKLSYMFYVAPKYNLSSHRGILEYGVNRNYNVARDVLVSITIGSQLMESGSSTTFGSLGLILFHTKK